MSGITDIQAYIEDVRSYPSQLTNLIPCGPIDGRAP